MAFTSIVSGNENESKYSTLFNGNNIPDGIYKIDIRAVKNISGSFGSRIVDFGKDKSFMINYKYPVPQPISSEFLHYYDVYYDYEVGRNKIRYAINLKYNFEEGVVVDGAEIKVNDNDKIMNSIESEKGNEIVTKYIPLLDKDGKNNFSFDFYWHDLQDNLKRRNNLKKTWQTPIDIDDSIRNPLTNNIVLNDDLIKRYDDVWTEISPDSSNVDFVEKRVNFDEIRERTLKYINHSKRKLVSIKNDKDGTDVNYTVFCENIAGPYFRKRFFQRRNGSETEIIKRYDSIPCDISQSDFKNLYTNLKDSVSFSSTNSYDKISNTMNWSLTLSYKDIDNNSLTADKIDYGVLYIYSEKDYSTPKLLFDASDVDETGIKRVAMSGLELGNYKFKLVSYNEACDSQSNSFESDLISVKPMADETMTTSYEVLEDDVNNTKFKLYINWKTYLKDVSGLNLIIQKKNSNNKYITYATYPMYLNAFQSNITYTNLDAGDYRYYFTFNSESCIFDKNKQVKVTEVVLNSSAIGN